MSDTSLIFNIFARNKTAKAFKEFSTGAKIAFAAVGVAAVKFGVDSVKAYAESEQSQEKLRDAYARFPALATGNIAALQELATARAKVTRFDDDATAAAAANLAQFGLNQTQLEQMIPLVQDYAAKTGKDLVTSSRDVGKAFLGSTRALKELGINYKPTGDKAKDMAAIQEILRKQVGGFAEKEGKTAAGQAAILGNQFGEVQETVGKALMPVLMGLGTFLISTAIPALQSMVDWASENQTTALALATAIGGLWAVIRLSSAATATWTALTTIAAGASKVWTVATTLHTSTLGTWIGVKSLEAGAWIRSTAATVAGTASMVASRAVTLAAAAATGVVTAAQWALNVALTANPIGLIIAAIALFVGALILAYNKSETFRNIVTAAWNGIKAAALGVVNWFKGTAWPVIKWVINAIVGYYTFLWNTFSNVVKWILDKGATLSKWFRELPGKIGGFFSGIADTIKTPFRIAFNAIASLWNNTVGRLSFTIPSWVPGIGGNGFSMPKVPMLAQGGTAVSAGLALVGENGPELLRMPRGASVIPLDKQQGESRGVVIQHLEVHAAPGERAEESLPRAMRRTVFELGLGGI